MLYVLINIYLLLFSVAKPNRISPLAIFLITFLLTTTYYNGSDWRAYEPIYYDQELFDLNFPWEPGLKYLFSVFSLAGLGFHLSLIVLKATTLIIVTRFIFKHSQRRVIAYSIFIMTCGYGLYIDNPLRQMMAIPFFLIALNFAYNKELIKFLLSIAAGALFHLSIIVFLPLYVLMKINKNLMSLLLVTLPAIFVTLLIVVSTFPSSLESLPVVGFYARHYIYENINFRISISGIFALLLYYTLLIIQRSQESNDHPDDPFRLCSFLFLISYMLGSFSDEILRFSYYLAIPYSIYLSNRADKIGKSITLFVVFAHLLQSTHIVFNSYKYLPYTNYFWSAINNDYKSYEFRSNYHFDANPNAVENK